MTTRLVEDPQVVDNVRVLADRVERETEIPAGHVEKDFWVTEVLRGVVTAASDLGIEIVFKGGTSLSKAYRIISRFSEDVDVLVRLPEDGTQGDRNQILKNLIVGAERATLLSSVVDPGSTGAGKKRGARFAYRPDSEATPGLPTSVLLELGSAGGALSSETRAVTSLLAEFTADQIEGTVEAEPVEARVMAPERTLVEKLVLLHTAHSDDSPAAAVRGARHFYDVWCLLRHDGMAAALAACGITIVAHDVCLYSRAADRPALSRPTGGFATSPAFNDGSHVAAARAEYESTVLGQLVWPHAPKPTFDECVVMVRRMSGHL